MQPKFTSMGSYIKKEDEYQLPFAIRSIPLSETYAQIQSADVRKQAVKTTYNLKEGVQPFGVPVPYFSILREATEETIEAANDISYAVEDTTFTDLLRKQFRISKRPHIVPDYLGSNHMLKTIFTDFFDIRSDNGLTLVTGILPQFPQVEHFVKRHRLYNKDGTEAIVQRFRFEAFQQPLPKEIVGLPLSADHLLLSLDTPFDDKVMGLASYYYHHPTNNVVMYVDNPNSPTGDVAKPDTIRFLADVCCRYPQRLLVIDEAFSLHPENSAIPLTDKYPNLIVVRTFSKIGFQRLKAGYAIMSEPVGKQFQKIRNPYDIPEWPHRVVTKLLQSGIMELFTTYVLEKTRAVKTDFIRQLEGIGTVINTSYDSTILYFDGRDRGFQKRLLKEGVDTASGFTSLEFDIATQTQQLISPSLLNLGGQLVRVSVPGDETATPEIVDRFRKAIKGKPEGRFP